MDFDVIVIGAGPGGYTAAIRCSQLGLKTAIVENDDCVGGTCMNRGCIPTKSLLCSSHVKNIMEEAPVFGVNATIKSIDFKRMIERAKEVVSTLNSGLSGLIKSNNVEIIKGKASFFDKNTLLLDNKNQVTSKNIIIATGAAPKMVPGLSIDNKFFEKGLIWTSKEALSTDYCPKSMLIVGSGAIGIEFASFYNSIDADVTVIEIQNRILINEDEAISKAALKAFEKKGIKFMLETCIENLSEKKGKVDVKFSSGKSSTFDVCLVAVGVSPNTACLNLEKISVKTRENGSIIVDKNMETSIKNIYAIGDVVDPPFLAHKASREGIICAERIAGITVTPPLDTLKIPSCTYSDPQIASIGMTEKKALENGLSIKVGKSYFKGNGKALATGESSGFVKVIIEEKTGEILGAHMIGLDVTELVTIFSVAISSELTEMDLLNTIFPHPTISECIYDAVLNAVGR